MEIYGHYKKMVNEALLHLSLQKKPEKLYDPITYILSLGGKRLRPVLALAACDLFGENPEKAIQAASGIEIFHNFTLLHDDIMDKADMRRGKETVHKKWNSNIAILSGDTMFALAYQQIATSSREQLHEILDTFTTTAIEVCEGQQYDMDFETSEVVTIPEYLNMIRLKTAVLLGASLKIGALIAGATTKQAQLIYDFGVNIGIAFQLKDDYLDAFGDLEKFGKNIGGDIAANKKTYIYLKCLEIADKQDRSGLLELYQQTQGDSKAKINEVIEIFNKYDLKNHTLKEMENFFGKSLELMDKIEANPDKKNQMVRYAEWLYKRDH